MSTLFGFTDPWSDLRHMQRQMDRLVNTFVAAPAGFDITADVPLLPGGLPSSDVGTALTTTGGGMVGRWNPRVDVCDTDKSLVLHAELPGCNKEDIKLSVENNRLILQGEKKTKQKEEGENWVRRERFEGTFYRALPLPRGVDANQIQANFNNGVLEVLIPKTEEAAKKHLIDIKTSEGGSIKQEGEKVPIGGERGQKL